MTSVDSNFNFLCGHPHGAWPPPRPHASTWAWPFPPPCIRHKWMAPNWKSIFQALYDSIGQKFPVETFLTNASVALLSFSWPTDTLNLALRDSNEIVCVSYWGFIPKLHF